MGKIWTGEEKCTEPRPPGQAETPAYSQALLRGQTLIGHDGRLTKGNAGPGEAGERMDTHTVPKQQHLETAWEISSDLSNITTSSGHDPLLTLCETVWAANTGNHLFPIIICLLHTNVVELIGWSPQSVSSSSVWVCLSSALNLELWLWVVPVTWYWLFFSPSSSLNVHVSWGDGKRCNEKPADNWLVGENHHYYVIILWEGWVGCWTHNF